MSKREYGQSWMLAAALLDKSRTLDELERYYRSMGRSFGVNLGLTGRGNERMRRNVERQAKVLLERGWAVEEGGLYSITEAGSREARRMLADLERGGRFVERATKPETVSKTTLVVHFLLAAIKLPAALASGSVALLNDALDTLMDGISSLFVFFGIRSGRERLASFVLLGFMSLTGGYTLYESILRIARPRPLEADWLAFLAVALSAGISALLWLYQRYVGLKRSCVPIIAQSIDSRNHIVVAGGVGAGLIASLFHFPVLDQIVGLAVSALILKGALELLVDLLKSRGEGEIDLSRYAFTGMERLRRRNVIDWFLFEIENGRLRSKERLLDEARLSSDFSAIDYFRALGLGGRPELEGELRDAAHELFDKGLAVEITRSGQAATLRLTEAGERELRRALAKGWSLGEKQSSSSSSNPARGAARAGIRILLTAARLAILYSVLRWVLGFLPALELWGASSVIEGSVLARVVALGPISLTLAQLLCLLCGFVFLYGGRGLARPALYEIHHARERGTERPLYLVTEGPFSRRRHPMYAGAIMTSLGLGIALHSVYTLVWAGLAIALRLLGAEVEDRRLGAWFGEEYREYRNRTPRSMFAWWQWALVLAFFCLAWLGI